MAAKAGNGGRAAGNEEISESGMANLSNMAAAANANQRLSGENESQR